LSAKLRLITTNINLDFCVVELFFNTFLDTTLFGVVICCGAYFSQQEIPLKMQVKPVSPRGLKNMTKEDSVSPQTVRNQEAHHHKR